MYVWVSITGDDLKTAGVSQELPAVEEVQLVEMEVYV